MRFFLKKNRMMLITATNLDRKSGGAKWRDLQFFPRNRPLLCHVDRSVDGPSANQEDEDGADEY
jgi:hypothetical protein